MHTPRRTGTLARAAGLAAAWLCSAAALAQGAPSAAPPRPVTDRYFGVAIEDPYRHFENLKNPEVAAWMKAQAEHARATLDRIPGRAALLARIERYDTAVSARVARVVRQPGERYFIERRAAGENQYKLYLREGLQGRERLLVDPEVQSRQTGKPHAINWFAPSPDGRLLAYGVSAQGSEEAVLHLLDTRSGRAVGRPITRANFGGVDWSPDGRTLYFNRLQALRPGMAPTQKYQHSQVWALRAGAPEAQARPVFGAGRRGVDIGAAELPFVNLTHDGRWAIGLAVNGTQRELGVFLAPQASLRAGRPAWKRLIAAADAVTGLAYFDDRLYLVTHRGAPRRQVLALDLNAPDMGHAEQRVAPSERVVVNVAAAADALYIESREGNVKRLARLEYSPEARPVEVPLPVEGSFELAGDEGGGAVDPRLPGLLLGLQSWTRAPQIYALAADGSVSNTGLQPQGPYDAPADIVATEVEVLSHDGARVPMSIIHRKGIALDGSHPTLLYGYASYGMTEEPYFSPGRLAWIDAGGVFAVANPRGSGVYGEAWYRDGFQASKPNTWRDFIACAEYLVGQKYTQPARLGILGGSAGGILVGRAMTERPDLFGAVVSAVGALDLLRAETTPNGVPNIPEFGSVKTEAGFRALLAMSPYEHLRPGTPYPAVLLTHGVNDPRVEVWNSSKFGARLQAASTSRRPVLLRLDYEAGHGVGSTRSQALQERADIYAFLLWQLGQPGYQPP